MNGLALRTLLKLAGGLLLLHMAWASWASVTLIDLQVSNARLEAKIDAVLEPLGPTVTRVE